MSRAILEQFVEALDSGTGKATIPTAQGLADAITAAQAIGSVEALKAVLELAWPSALIGILYQLEKMNATPQEAD